MQSEISMRRNQAEPSLRKIIKRQLKSVFGEEEAKKKMIAEIYGNKEINKYIHKDYSEFFDPNKHNLFFKNLNEIMKKNWEKCFKNIFDTLCAT